MFERVKSRIIARIAVRMIKRWAAAKAEPVAGLSLICGSIYAFDWRLAVAAVGAYLFLDGIARRPPAEKSDSKDS